MLKVRRAASVVRIDDRIFLESKGKRRKVEQHDKKIKRFVEECRNVGRYNLVRCSSGNMSWRIGEDEMLITRSGSWMINCTEEDVCRCRISDGTLFNGIKPSSEIIMHRQILLKRPDVDTVLHYQAPWATTLACSEYPLDNIAVIIEIPYYVGSVSYVPFFMPGSAQLADAVAQTMKDNNIVLMKNHGEVVVGKTFEDIFQRALFFELAAEIFMNLEGRVTPLSAEAQRMMKNYKT